MAQDRSGETDIADLAAETAGSADLSGRTFTPADFSRFAPKTALDMVRQIPGFSIQGGDDGQRGLGQARQNVLINGQRVSGKSNDAATVLSRIAAGDVERIELVDGATLDIPGLSGQVANVIANSSAFNGSFTWRPEVRPGIDDNWFRGEISLSGRIGKTDWSASLNNNNNTFRNGHWGPEFQRAADGTLIETRDEYATNYGDNPRLAGSISRTADNGNILNVSAAGQLYNYTREITGDVVRPDGNRFDEFVRSTEREWNAELGGDYEFALGGGRLKLIGLQRFEHSPFTNVFTRLGRAAGSVTRGNRFDQTVDEGESILRGEYRWKSGAADWQVSVEGAYNTLESDAVLFLRDANGDEQQAALPGANAKVSEKRTESILTYGRPLSDSLAMQANIGAEYSNIVVSGPGGSSRSFIRPKGSLGIAWTASPDLTINAKVERRVDQLNFFDFLASVDVANNTGRSNNPELEPPQRWRMEIDATKRLGAWGSIKPFLRIARIEGVVDSIPVSPTQEALGNLDGVAMVYQPGIEGTLLFDPVGWKGAKLDIFAQATISNLKDPLTGQDRAISGSQKYNYSLNLRHDILRTDWAWGGFVERDLERPAFRLDQVSRAVQTRPFAGVFIENKDVFGLTVRGEWLNLLNSKDRYDRTVHIDRRDGPIAFTEDRVRTFGRFWRFSESGAF